MKNKRLTTSLEGSRQNAVVLCPRSSAWNTTSEPVSPFPPKTAMFVICIRPDDLCRGQAQRAHVNRRRHHRAHGWKLDPQKCSRRSTFSWEADSTFALDPNVFFASSRRHARFMCLLFKKAAGKISALVSQILDPNRFYGL